MYRPNAIELSVLPGWNKLSEYHDPPDEVEEANHGKGVNFPIRADLNEKMILWQGDIRLVDVDAIVNSTNETMTDMTGLSGAILEAAGPELRDEIYRIERCRTGEARLTKGYNLCARYVIHTVGPRYHDKYKIAAENALHGCYRSSLETLKEHRLSTIALPVINGQKKGYPFESGCHIAVRTVRRFLEHWGKDISRVVFCVTNTTDFNMYSRIFPFIFHAIKRNYYWPRRNYPGT